MAGNDGTLKFDTRIDGSGFQKGLDHIGSAAQKGLSATAKVLGGAAAGVTALAGAAIKVGSDFEAGMSQVQAIAGTVADKDLPGIIRTAKEMGLSFEEGANTTETAMNILSAKAKEMGASTKFSATESAEALNYMAMAGWKTEDMLKGIEGIMNLAAASGEDLAATSDIVTDALTAFGMSASDSTHFADILAAASSNANTNVGMMGETFKYVAPVAGALGYSAEDTALAIGLMANSGIKASQAGTALRSMLTRLAKPTKESETAMKELGITLDDGEGNMKSFKEIMNDLRSGFGELMIPQDEFNERLASLNSRLADGTLTQKKYDAEVQRLIGLAYGAEGAEKAKYAAMLAGQEAMSGLLAIVNASDEDFEKLSGAIMNCTGSAEEMAAIMQDNLQGQLVILQSGLEGLGVALYETMQDTAKDVVKEAQGMVQQLKDAFDTGGFEGLVGSVGNVLAQIVQRIAEAAPAVIEAAVSLVTSFCDGLKSAPGIGESGASLITSLVTGLFSCVGEIWTTAIVLIGKLAEGIAEGAPQMVQAASTAVTDIVECIADGLPDFLQAGGTIITALAEGVAGMLPVLAGRAVNIASTLFDTLMSALPQAAAAGAGLLDRLAEGIAANLPRLIPTAMQALVEFSGSLRENIGLLVDAGLNLVMTLAQSLIDGIPVFIETVPAIITNIAGIINDNAPKLLAAGIELIGNLAMGLIKAVPTLVSNIPQIIQAVVSVFTAFNWLALGKNIITAIANGVKSFVAAIPNAVHHIPDLLKGIFNKAVSLIRGINWRTLGTDIINFMVNGIKSLLTAIPNLLKSIGGMAVNFFKSIDWLDLGINVIKGLVAGITGALDGLWDALGGLCSGMLDSIKGFFGIHSPSTVMAEQGDFLVQGLVNGIAGMPAELAAYLDETVQKVMAWGQQMLGNAQAIMRNVVNTAVKLIAQLPGKIWTWLVNVVTKVVQWGQQMMATASNAIQNMISSIISLLSQLPGKVWTWLANVIAKAVEWGRQMLDNARTAIGSMVSAVISLLSELPGKVAAKLSDVLARVAEWCSDMIRKGAEAARGLFDAVVDGISGLPDKMAEVGSNIITGIWNGISGGWEWLKGKVADVANSLLDSAKGALGINSPSRAFRDEFGKWLMPGTMEGVRKSMPGTLREMREQAGELLAAMQGTVAASMGEVSLNASGAAGALALASAGTVVYNDNRMEQENNYHVPVATPAETNRAQREAFRKFAGGVK